MTLPEKIREKIKIHKELEEEISRLRKEGKIIVQCHGVFDLVHPGHIHQFNQARHLGDILVVSVVDDKYVEKGPGRPYFPERLRMEWVASLTQVDYVVLCNSPGPWEVMNLIKPDFYVKGDDTKHLLDDPASGVSKDKETIEALGGKMYFTKTLPIHSPDLLQEFFNTHPPELKEFLRKFKTRYSEKTLLGKINGFKKLKVLVIGETIIDEYDYVVPLGKPSKSNAISTKYVEREAFAGGALACANHLNDFCKRISLVTCLGQKNSKEEFARSHLKPNIKPEFFYRKDSPTIVKRRFVDPAYFGKLFEICFLNEEPIKNSLELEIIDWLNRYIKFYDVVIIADYGHGLLTPNLIKMISEKARFLAVNTQTNSANQGYNSITKFPKADYVCLTEQEARIATRDRFSDIKKLIPGIAEKISSKKMSATKGPNGALVYEKESGIVEIPALTDNVIDPIGAGDTYLVISSLAAALGYPSDLVGFLGSVAGAMATKIVCNRSSIRMADFMRYVDSLLIY